MRNSRSVDQSVSSKARRAAADGPVHVLGGTVGDLADHLLGGRVDVVEGLARGRLDELAVDEHVRFRIDGHLSLMALPPVGAARGPTADIDVGGSKEYRSGHDPQLASRPVSASPAPERPTGAVRRPSTAGSRAKLVLRAPRRTFRSGGGPMNLEGRSAIVTGGAGGLGSATVRRFDESRPRRRGLRPRRRARRRAGRRARVTAWSGWAGPPPSDADVASAIEAGHRPRTDRRPGQRGRWRGRRRPHRRSRRDAAPHRLVRQDPGDERHRHVQHEPLGLRGHGRQRARRGRPARASSSTPPPSPATRARAARSPTARPRRPSWA